MKRLFVSVFAALLVFSSPGFASTGKEFTTSVIYGTLAGTLVGAATLAFTSNPGDNLNNVARGASYGLYAGILLGLYVTYGVSDTPSEPERIPQEPGIYEGAPPPVEEGKPQGGRIRLRQDVVVHDQRLPSAHVALVPVLDRSNDGHGGFGAAVHLTGFSF